MAGLCSVARCSHLFLLLHSARKPIPSSLIPPNLALRSLQGSWECSLLTLTQRSPFLVNENQAQKTYRAYFLLLCNGVFCSLDFSISLLVIVFFTTSGMVSWRESSTNTTWFSLSPLFPLIYKDIHVSNQWHMAQIIVQFTFCYIHTWKFGPALNRPFQKLHPLFQQQ